MSHTLTIILAIISVILCLLVVIQSKGNGLSLAPGSGDFGKFERRGPEKILHLITLAVFVAFILFALAIFFLAP